MIYEVWIGMAVVVLGGHLFSIPFFCIVSIYSITLYGQIFAFCQVKIYYHSFKP